MKLETAIERAAVHGKSYRDSRWEIVVGTEPRLGTTTATIELLHHGTFMARALGNIGKEKWYLHSYRHGWGSVSDQTGMNKFFKVLNLPYRYWRTGGAHVELCIRGDRA